MTGLVSRIKGRPLLLIFFLSLTFHLWHIGADLPYNYNTDEPHHINKAANFGNGHLNPHDFKYPTLWSYVLAMMLGGLFVIGKFVGVVSSTLDFAQKFLYSNGFFIFCGRILSTFFLSLVPVIFYKLGVRYYTKPFALTMAFFAFISSSMSDFGLQAVPYSLLVFFAACSLYSLHGVLEGHGRIAYIKTGFFVGLAISSHYVAAPLASVLVIAFFRETKLKTKIQCFAFGVLAVMGGFFIGTPFLLLDFKNAIPDFSDHYQIEKVSVFSMINVEHFRLLFDRVLKFMDLWGVGFTLAVIGLITQIRLKRWRVLLWFLPLASAWPILLKSFYGAAHRYTVLLAVPYFIPAAHGFFFLLALCRTSSWKRTIVVIGIFGLFIVSYTLNRLYIAIPDTRTIAKSWIDHNVPAGEKILSPGPFEGPPLIMSKNQVERLHQKTLALNHPREVYYRTLLSGHPGGGYEIFYVAKTIDEIMDLPGRTERAFQAQEFVDVCKEGIEALHRNNIHWVVILKNWENRERYQDWIHDLRNHFNLVASFKPEENIIKGYFIEIYNDNAR